MSSPVYDGGDGGRDRDGRARRRAWAPVAPRVRTRPETASAPIGQQERRQVHPAHHQQRQRRAGALPVGGQHGGSETGAEDQRAAGGVAVVEGEGAPVELVDAALQGRRCRSRRRVAARRIEVPGTVPPCRPRVRRTKELAAAAIGSPNHRVNVVRRPGDHAPFGGSERSSSLWACAGAPPSRSAASDGHQHRRPPAVPAAAPRPVAVIPATSRCSTRASPITRVTWSPLWTRCGRWPSGRSRCRRAAARCRGGAAVPTSPASRRCLLDHEGGGQVRVVHEPGGLVRVDDLVAELDRARRPRSPRSG